MYKIIVLAVFVVAANCNSLDRLNGAWYPLAFFLPGEDLGGVYQVCHSNVYSKSDKVFVCGGFNVTGGIFADFGDGTTYEAPAIVVNTFQEVSRTLSLLKACENLNIFRFIGNYLIAYNNYVTESNINMYLLSKDVPTQSQLEAFIRSVNELDSSDDDTIVCTQEVQTADTNRRGSQNRDPKKNKSPSKILQSKMFPEIQHKTLPRRHQSKHHPKH